MAKTQSQSRLGFFNVSRETFHKTSVHKCSKEKETRTKQGIPLREYKRDKNRRTEATEEIVKAKNESSTQREGGKRGGTGAAPTDRTL